MKTKIRLPLSEKQKCLVDIGDKITTNTTIFECVSLKEETSINISRILKVNKEKILTYVKKRVGDRIEVSEVIAERKNLFSSVKVKSPNSGKISDINLHTGVVTFSSLLEGEKQDIYSPVEGKISAVEKDYLEVEVEGLKINGEWGKGVDVTGKLICLEGENLDVLDFNQEIDGCIVLCKSLTDGSSVKMDVMGVLGLITLKRAEYIHLPYIQVNKDSYLELEKKTNKHVWLRPEEKQVIVFS